jgi:hypothetical protein
MGFEWVWEQRGEGEFNPPQIATFVDGWQKWRGDMATDLPFVSEVFVRELVQNFMDAAREEANRGSAKKAKLRFQFINLTGAAAKDMSQKLNLESLKERFASFDEHKKKEVRLREGLTLKGETESYLPLLVVSESGTTGMYGQWDRTNAPGVATKMRDALLSIARGTAGRGLGAFGEGKKAVMGISVPRCLFAYTNFDAELTTDGVTRRFMGATYWQDHTFGNSTYSGLAMIGAPLADGENRPKPLTDEAADSAVEDLNIEGFNVRTKGDSGTTYLFVEPTISAAEVAESLARNWWPVIEQDLADFEIIDENGSTVEVSFGQELLPYLQAYKAVEDVKVDWNNQDATAEGISTLVKELTYSDGTPLGVLKLAIDFRPTIGWSRLEPETNTSLVALVRDGMLISYQHFPRSKRHAPPFVRGVFQVTKNDQPVAEENLRITEPPLHNKWQESNASLDPLALKYAASVYSQILENVEEFRNQHVKDDVRREIDLELFSEGLSVQGGKRVIDPPTPPPVAATPWSLLNVEGKVEDLKNGQRKAVAKRSIKLSPTWSAPHEVKIVLGWEVLEDGSRWVEATSSLLASVSEFDKSFTRDIGSRNVFTGFVTQTPMTFSWETTGYEDLWTLRPYMKVSSVRPRNVEDSENE